MAKTKQKPKIEKCFCGHLNAHTRECKRKNTFLRFYEVRKKRWKERVKNHQCGDCGKKVEPKIIYPSRCKCCNDKNNGQKNTRKKE